jgi:hypothetical protein
VVPRLFDGLEDVAPVLEPARATPSPEPEPEPLPVLATEPLALADGMVVRGESVELPGRTWAGSVIRLRDGSHACTACLLGDFWQRHDGAWVCGICHPHPDVVASLPPTIDPGTWMGQKGVRGAGKHL